MTLLRCMRTSPPCRSCYSVSSTFTPRASSTATSRCGLARRVYDPAAALPCPLPPSSSRPTLPTPRPPQPANILLTESCDLKLCDFGLARSLDGEEDDETDAERSAIGVQNSSAAAMAAAAAEAAAAAAAGGMMHDDSDMAAASAGGGTGAASAPLTSGGGSATSTALSSSGSMSSPVKRAMTKHVVTRW